LRRAGSLACCALALLTKETCIILPLLIFLQALAGIPESDCNRTTPRLRLDLALRAVMPYLLVTAAYLAIRFYILRGLPSSPSWISPADAFLTLPSVLFFYLRHLIWPASLSLYYDLPVVSRASSFLFCAPLVLLAALCVGAVLGYRRSRNAKILLALAWFFLPLAPVAYIGIFQPDDFIHDRYLYLPVLALAILVGLIGEYFSRVEVRARVSSLALVLVGLAIISLALATVVETRPWMNNLPLYTNAVQRAPKNPLARNNLGREYAARRQYQEAGKILKPLLEEHPEMWLANYNYGYVNYYLGNLAVAEDYLEHAIRIDPDNPDEHVYLGTTYLKQGRLKEAAEQMRAAVARKPDGVGYHFTWGVIYLQQGNLAQARAEMQKELQYHPENTQVRAQVQALDNQFIPTR
jgi:protein O-mannosyl-transferase